MWLGTPGMSGGLLDSDQEHFGKTWSILRNAIDEIHNHNAGTLSYEELYRYGYNLVIARQGRQLYDNVRQTLCDYLHSITQHVLTLPVTQLPQAVDKAWRDHTTTLKLIADVLMYLDRSFCAAKGLTPVYLLGIQLFREIVLENCSILRQLIDQMLEQIQKSRDGDAVNYKLLRNLTSMLGQADPQIQYYRSQRTAHVQETTSLKAHGEFYATHFEETFLKTTKLYYQQESREALSSLSVAQFLAKAEERIREELRRANAILEPSTLEPLHCALTSAWISCHGPTILKNPEEGCKTMFDNDRLEDLSRLYRLIKTDPALLSEAKSSLETSIVQAGDSILTSDAEHSQYPRHPTPIVVVEKLLELQAKYRSIVSTAFKRDAEFQRAMVQGLRHVVNRDPHLAQALALMVDDMLRHQRGSWEYHVGTSDYETQAPHLERRLDDVMSLFRCGVADYREVAERMRYNNRALTARGVSGHAYTSKLEGMLRDIAKSRELMMEFTRLHGGGNILAPGNFSALVLTTGTWPSQAEQFHVTLPPTLASLCQAYESFYTGRHTGRKLTWSPWQGFGELRGTFAKSRHDIVVRTVQLLILLMFNTSTTLTFADLVDYLKPSDVDELKRYLVGLFANPKLRLLNCTSASPKRSPWHILPDDVFEVNESFESKLLRIRVPQVTLKPRIPWGGGLSTSDPLEDNALSIPRVVDEDRRLQVDAAITRIMKSRRELSHQHLVLEVTKLLQPRFCPKPSVIKARIENLIERDFLERAPTDV